MLIRNIDASNFNGGHTSANVTSIQDRTQKHINYG